MKYSLLAVAVLCLVAANSTNGAAELIPEPEGKANVEIFVLHASTQGKGFDKRLPAQMKKQLQRPPYSAYTRYTLLTRRQTEVAFKAPLIVKLPDRGALRLLVQPPTKQRYRVKAEIRKPTSKKFLPALQTRARANKVFFISGHKHNKGTLFVGVRLTAK